MGDGFLKPGDNLGRGRQDFFGQVALILSPSRTSMPPSQNQPISILISLS
jgi:hypothetical protein